ncbi:TetR/AcrR family transcriptional regulator [Micromonospora endolithica]|uniref:TetR/AcrR family transcriptional regulator n=1 Tax=Micromonospora endolithica TaxID=230091 RepID=A0A3A9ZLH6_9ACTN|nr:TetR/AcrR family transcriptional regulator [Micromonospora endolithica]RKN49181.1 TetR/AcrR family transcriptional regulator [Micromonospora endolithica]TWJ23348.1 TetR family transcriptional regulator [Micromonospora endolithica]
MTQDDRSTGSRERILAAAVAMFGEDVTARLSVRAVAARAGVSTGSLRFHFPTQRALQDAVLARIYDHVFPDDPIHDRSLPARDRLVNCLRQVLAPAGVGEQAREAWSRAHEAYITSDPTEEVRAAYLAMEREGWRRIEYWLTVLADEGALPKEDHARRVRFLLTVLNGLSIERALPAEASILKAETETLYTAVDCVLDARTA